MHSRLVATYVSNASVLVLTKVEGHRYALDGADRGIDESSMRVVSNIGANQNKLLFGF
jgi:hypothetical protein